MEILVRHHDKSKTVQLKSGRKLRLPADVYRALVEVRAQGAIPIMYLHGHAVFFIGGLGEMRSQWLEAWNTYRCGACGHTDVMGESGLCSGCGEVVSRLGIMGDFEPFVSVDEFIELVCGLSTWFKRFNPEKSQVGTIFEGLHRMNIRGTACFQRWKGAVVAPPVLGDGT